jgi:copper chaperone CopZ
MTTLILEVPGMSCGHCESAVKGAVGNVAGVRDVGVDLTSKLVTVAGENIDVNAIKVAIDGAGYEVVAQYERS